MAMGSLPLEKGNWQPAEEVELPVRGTPGLIIEGNWDQLQQDTSLPAKYQEADMKYYKYLLPLELLETLSTNHCQANRRPN